MAEPEVDRPCAPSDAVLPCRRPWWARGLALGVMIPLMGFIGLTGSTLWGEWRSLREAQVDERESAIVGYVNINPNPNYAASPPDWHHDEGTDSLLWAGWKEGEHRWFRFGRGDLAGLRLSWPIGRDSIQAIDHPIFEREGGACWVRIPAEAQVAGFEAGGRAVAYPIKVLNKVEVVNDLVADRAVLIVQNPDVEPISIFDSTLDGRRVTLGHSGYFVGKLPLLYDRGTQSLWAESGEEGTMTAVAGPRKGAALRRIARVNPIPWSEWLASHPDGVLVAGADRSKAPPVD